MNKPGGRTLVAILLAASDVLLAAASPLLFFMPSVGILMFLAFPAGLALARWQYRDEPWEMRRQAAMTTLLFLVGLFTRLLLLVIAGRTRPDEFEVGAALMLLAVAWAGLSTYAIGLISLRASWKPASST
ncbi:MAG TPA: hypothetical protein VGB18_08470 [Candidatus Thermoplasmatota archaeon]